MLHYVPGSPSARGVSTCCEVVLAHTFSECHKNLLHIVFNTCPLLMNLTRRPLKFQRPLFLLGSYLTIGYCVLALDCVFKKNKMGVSC